MLLAKFCHPVGKVVPCRWQMFANAVAQLCHNNGKRERTVIWVVSATSSVRIFADTKLIIMRKNFGAKPLTYPQPVFIIATYGEDGTPDAMNAAWGGISEMKEISMCLSAGHKTVKNILNRKAFTVSMAEAGHVAACDYVGLVSGNKVPDKFSKAGFHATKSEFVDAPLIDELSIAVECVLKDYDPDTCILRGEILNVSVDERVLDENGNVDAAKVAPIIFDPFNNDYLKVGEKVGNAFSDGKLLK